MVLAIADDILLADEIRAGVMLSYVMEKKLKEQGFMLSRIKTKYMESILVLGGGKTRTF